MNKFDDKYFRDKAYKLWDEMRHEKYADDKEAIYILLKEVARDVRHACAEKVLQVNPICSESFNSFDGGVELTKSEAHRACVNL